MSIGYARRCSDGNTNEFRFIYEDVMINKVKQWMHWRGVSAKDMLVAGLALSFLVSIPVFVILSIVYG